MMWTLTLGNSLHKSSALVAVALAAALACTAMFASSARAQDDATAGLAIGAKAPLSTLEMKNVDGKSITLASAAGKKGTLVLFICNHCPWVKAWQGRIATIGNEAMKQGFGVVAINSNDPAAYPEDDFAGMQKRAKEVGYKFAYAVDETSNMARAFGATHTPEAYLFDASGKLVYHGAIDDNAHDEKGVKQRWLADAVTAVRTGKPVAAAETKALGCGIKTRPLTAD